jgi:hypothetical protein
MVLLSDRSEAFVTDAPDPASFVMLSFPTFGKLPTHANWNLHAHNT